MNNRRLVWALTALNLFISIKTYGVFLSISLSDTVDVKRYLDLGDKVKLSQPDSGLFYYQNALKILTKKDERSNQKDYWFALVHLKLATYYNDLHQANKALEHNSIAFPIAERIASKGLIASLLNNKGQICSFKARYDSAMLFFKKSLLVSRELRDQKLEAKIWSNMGVVMFYRGETDSAFTYFRKPLAIAEKINDKELLAGAYNNLGRMYFRIGKMDEALTHHQKARKLFEEMKDSVDIILCENNIANIFYMRADYVAALERYSSLIPKCLRVKDMLTLAKVYHNMGQVYYDIFAFSEATNYYIKSIEIKQKLNDEQGVSLDYLNLGSVQISNKNPRKALEYYRKAHAIFERIDSKAGLAKIYNDFGNVYLELNKPDSVLFYLKKAENLAVKINELSTLATIYYSFAELYLKISDYTNALNYYNKNIKINEQLGDLETIGIDNYKIAEIYNSLGSSGKTIKTKNDYFQKALTYANKAYKIGTENNLIEVKSESAKQLKNAYKELRDFNKALYFADIYSSTKDSVFKKTQSDAAIYAEACWQAEKKQQQIDFLENEKALKEDLLISKESENKKQRTVIYLLCGGIFVLLTSAAVIAYFVRRQRKLEYQQQLSKISMLKLENARSRVSPHFLFNSLASIQDELSDKPDARKRLDAIINMLRCSLLNVEKPAIPLKEEMEFVDNYLLLQKAKFMDDLHTQINIENNDLFDYNIPAMIVQIPVENAIKHGLAGKHNGERVLKVDARRENGTLKISVADNGVGRMAASSAKFKGTGTGLKVISQTLHLLNSRNDKKIQFQMIDLKDGDGANCGTKVDISIPVNYNFEL